MRTNWTYEKGVTHPPGNLSNSFCTVRRRHRRAPPPTTSITACCLRLWAQPNHQSSHSSYLIPYIMMMIISTLYYDDYYLIPNIMMLLGVMDNPRPQIIMLIDITSKPLYWYWRIIMCTIAARSIIMLSSKQILDALCCHQCCLSNTPIGCLHSYLRCLKL